MRFLLALCALALPVALSTMALVAFHHAQGALGPNPAGAPAPFPAGPTVTVSLVPIPTLDPCAVWLDSCPPPTPAGLSAG